MKGIQRKNANPSDSVLNKEKKKKYIDLYILYFIYVKSTRY